jgi:hypothetical protein
MSFVFDAKLEKLLELNGFDGDVYRNAGMGFLWSEDIDCYTRQNFEECGFTRAVCDRLVLLKEFVEAYLSAHPDERRPRATYVPAELVEWAGRRAAARGGDSVGTMLARFTALKTQMDRITKMLVLYDGVVTTVKGVQQSLAIQETGYTMAIKADVDDELMTAERCLRDMCRKEELLVALARARRLLTETQVVDAPGAAGGAQRGEKTVPQDLDMSQLLRRMQDVRE